MTSWLTSGSRDDGQGAAPLVADVALEGAAADDDEREPDDDSPGP